MSSNMMWLDYKFYIGTGDWATMTDKLILLRSNPYTHVELQRQHDLKSFSSSMRKDFAGKAEGVRFKMIGYSHPERWDTLRVWVTPRQYWAIQLRAEVLAGLGLKYDKRGIAGALITGKQNPWDWYCSEVVFGVTAPVLCVPELNYKMWPTPLYKVIGQIIIAQQNITHYRLAKYDV